MAMVKKQTFKITKATEWDNAEDVSTIVAQKHNANNEVTAFENLLNETHESGDMEGADWIDPTDPKVCHIVRYWTQEGWDRYQSLRDSLEMTESVDLTYEESVEDVDLDAAAAAEQLEAVVPQDVNQLPE